MAFGISFGSNKTKTNQTTNENKTTTGTQTGTENTSSTNQSSTSGSQTTTGSSTTSQQTNQQNTQSGTTTNQTTSTGSQSSFSQETANDIESAIRNLLGQQSGQSAAINEAVGALNGFDAASFINDTVESARSGIQSNLDAQTGQLFDNIGGTASTNSMAALLQGQLANQAASSLAGVRSQAEQTAAQIEQGNANAVVNAIGSQQGLAANLIQALKGGNVTTTSSDLAQQIANLTSGTTGSTTTAEQSQQQQESTQQTIQTLTQLISQILNTNQTETGTATTTGTNKSGGGGFSLGF